MKGKLLRTIAALPLAAALFAGAAGLPAFANPQEADTSSTAGESSRQVLTLQGEATNETTYDTASVPTFDLRDVDGVNYVTPVRAQYPFGVCWGFSAVAGSETSILSSGAGTITDPAQLNLSEKHLAYFSHWYIDDKSNPQNGEGMHVYDSLAADGISSSDVYTGGSVFLATNTFASGMGPVLESDDTLFEFRGKNGITQSYTDPVTGAVIDPFCYSPDDDWMLPESLRFKQDYILKEAYLLPSPAGSKDTDQQIGGIPISEYEYDVSGTEAIKDQLLQLRAVCIGFHADVSAPWQTGYGQYMPTKETTDTGTFEWAHYTWQGDLANHAVTIVGWDDNYSASNFAHKVYTLKNAGAEYNPDNFVTDDEGNYVVDEQATARTTPPGDGAWLVKNSWGAATSAFPNHGRGNWGIPVDPDDPSKGGSGYFWLSFYDQSIVDPEALVFDDKWNAPIVARTSLLDAVHRDQHDLMPAGTINTQVYDAEAKSANIFTPSEGEQVMCLSYEVAKPNTTVSYEVRLLHPGYTTPEDGVVMAKGSNTYQYGGYYMVDLDPYLTVLAGQSYSVIVTQRREDGTYAINVAMGSGKGSKLNDLLPAAFRSTEYAQAVVNPGESMAYVDGAWHDWAETSQAVKDAGYGERPMSWELISKMDTKTLDGYEFSDAQFDNFAIKGFALDQALDCEVQLKDIEKLVLCTGESTTVEMEVAGRRADIIDLDYFTARAWEFTDGGGTYAKVTPSAEGLQAQVSGLTPGTTYLYATIEGLGTAIVPVEVHEHAWGETSYSWADDYSEATATRVCGNCGKVESETVKTTSAVTKKPTESATGTRTYTAEFTSSWAKTQVKEVELAKLPKDESSSRSSSSSNASPSSSSSSSSSGSSSTSSSGSGPSAKGPEPAGMGMSSGSAATPKTADPMHPGLLFIGMAAGALALLAARARSGAIHPG